MPLCESLQLGRVGFGQSPRLRSMQQQQDGLSKGRVESQFRIQTESPVSPYSVQLTYGTMVLARPMRLCTSGVDELPDTTSEPR